MGDTRAFCGRCCIRAVASPSNVAIRLSGFYSFGACSTQHQMDDPDCCGVRHVALWNIRCQVPCTMYKGHIMCAYLHVNLMRNDAQDLQPSQIAKLDLDFPQLFLNLSHSQHSGHKPTASLRLEGEKHTMVRVTTVLPVDATS